MDGFCQCLQSSSLIITVCLVRVLLVMCRNGCELLTPVLQDLVRVFAFDFER